VNFNDNLPPGVTDRDIEDACDDSPRCRTCGRILRGRTSGDCKRCAGNEDQDEE